ncbi:hypothetical protein [Pedobacter sp.]|uniref:hypothetical protein n=1 Tax=Pedobacter sp. TaxID=1411316 RepID=UPI003BACFF6C
MEKRSKKILWGITVVFFIPILMLLAWALFPKTKLVVAIIDKTMPNQTGQEHVSLHWVLNHEKLTKTSRLPYEVSRDYFGFFPKGQDKYQIKGLERFNQGQLNQLSADADAVYFTDTYGTYEDDWHSKTPATSSNSLIYGGLSNQDISLLELMKKKHKLIITEYNTIGSPTNSENRAKFEKLFGLHWTGWTARYFNSLDTLVNKELPKWLIKNYQSTHHKAWKFSQSGIAFVNDGGAVVILEDHVHLSQSVPHIETSTEGQKKYGVPQRISYPFWFDVMAPDTTVNKVVSTFNISTNKEGVRELNKFGIPNTFPAVLSHQGNDYRFYYFSGDFCDNPISITSSYFKGISWFSFLFYDTSDTMDRKNFFWNFYRPMLTEILTSQEQ